MREILRGKELKNEKVNCSSAGSGTAAGNDRASKGGKNGGMHQQTGPRSDLLNWPLT